jgi:hypothetical protein
MERAFQDKKKDARPHRWLGLQPVDFVRAAERRAAAMTQEQGSQRSRAQRHYPLPPVPYPLSSP